MNRASLAATTAVLVALLALASPQVLPHGGASPALSRTPVAPTHRPTCARPGFGAADTDAVLLCVAAHDQP